MSGWITIKNSVRDFLRKYDEVTTPVIRFVFSFIMFSCINSLFGYSDFLGRGMIVFLLSVISALVTEPVVVFLAGIVVAIHCFSVSIDIGILCLLLFLVIYCSYVRMFQETGFVLFLVPILFMLKLSYAVPVLVAILAGFSGAIPAAFGVVVFYFSTYVREANATILLGEDADFQGYAFIVKGLTTNKDMLFCMLAFVIVVMVTSLIYKLSFDYAWYVAIGVGSVFTILVVMIYGMMVDVDVPVGSLVIGALAGCVIGFIVQLCKSVVDYSHKETVQFEDDDYYYYVKAIPKFQVPQKNKSVRNITEEASADEVKKQVQAARPQQGRPMQAAQPQQGRPTQAARPQQGRPTQAARPQQGRPGQPDRPQRPNGQKK